MILKSLKLQNFRNFNEAQFDLHPKLTIILGPNAVGKTNLLESIHFILTGNGVKEENMSELVTFDQNQTILLALLKNDFQEMKLTSIISTNTINNRKISINGVVRSVQQLLSTCPGVVLFTPRLLSIIDTDPSARRQYFDKVISKVDKNYATALHNYNNALTKRNKLISKLFSHPNHLKEELIFWDDYLIKNALILTDYRQRYVDRLNCDQKIQDYQFQITYLPNLIDTITLEASFEKSLILLRTLVGPQKDDFCITLKSKSAQPIDIHTFGSRSQQRLALFWLKLHELSFFEEKLDEKPILLLDDIISELDEDNQRVALNTIRNFQTILTTTESSLAKMVDDEYLLIELKASRK